MSIVTAAILVIGDEILSGRTKDKNIGYIAEYLTNIGIDLKEVRVVPDEEDEIVAALNALRSRYTYVFTTGGIGPTHDDITADCVAKAFGVTIDVDPRARKHHGRAVRRAGVEMNEARLRMARIPAGADLVENKQSGAPGFWIGNVHRDGGRAVDHAGDARCGGAEAADRREDDVRDDQGRRARGRHRHASLARSPRQHPNVTIGSYPFFDEKSGPNTNLVIRSRDAGHLAAARADVEAMLVRVRAGMKASA